MAIFRLNPNARSIRFIAYARDGQIARLAMALNTIGLIELAQGY
jgi:hypothetical protein